MKKALFASLVAAPVLAFSSMAHASEPMMLTEAQMDGVVAAYGNSGSNYSWIGQINISPVTVVQLNLLSVGGGNAVVINSGNFARVYQR